MRNVWGTDVPIRLEDYPEVPALAKSFRRCRCGQTTFLDMPCHACGNQHLEPVFEAADKRARKSRILLVLIGLPVLAAACILLGLIWPPLIVAALIVAGIAVLPSIQYGSREIFQCYWIFHSPTAFKKMADRTPYVEPAALDEISNGYDNDLAYLNHLLHKNPTMECAQLVFRQAQNLTSVYHNRRVSALMMECLIHLPVEDGICLDVDQICEYLQPEDLKDDKAALAKLYDCVRFTSLCPGEETAKFVLRYCAERLQQAQLRQNPGKTIVEAAETRPLFIYFAPKERKMLAAIWNYSSIGHVYNPEAPGLKCWSEPAAVELSQKALRDLPPHNNLMAIYWYDHVWYSDTGRPALNFRSMIESNGNDFAIELMAKWGRGKGGDNQ